MNHTSKHLAYSLVWLLGFILAFFITFSYLNISDVGQGQFYSDVGTLAAGLGFTAIFYSWARLDALKHDKPKHTTLTFTALWPFLTLIAHFAYLFYTRGWRNGFIASLKFVCFILASAIGFALLAKFTSLIFS